MAGAGINSLVIPVSTAIASTYGGGNNANLFSGNNLILPVLPGSYTPTYSGDEDILDRGYSTAFYARTPRYYSFEVTTEDGRADIVHALADLQAEADASPTNTGLILLNDYVKVERSDRVQGFTARLGLLRVEETGGSITTDTRRYPGIKLNFRQV